MLIKNIYCFLAILISFQLFSQNKLTGFVRDKQTSETLPGVILYFPDLKNSGVSKSDGSFEINNLPSIKTLLQVRLMGYQTIIKTIDLATTNTLYIEMEQTHIEANEVVVTGVSKATEIKRNPVPMVSID